MGLAVNVAGEKPQRSHLSVLPDHRSQIAHAGDLAPVVDGTGPAVIPRAQRRKRMHAALLPEEAAGPAAPRKAKAADHLSSVVDAVRRAVFRAQRAQATDPAAAPEHGLFVEPHAVGIANH